MLPRKFIQAVFFGNYFYGICAVALSIEASMQQRYPLNGVAWYIFVFAALVLYYTYAYIGESAAPASNKRSLWYVHNRTAVTVSIIACSLAAITSSLFILWQSVKNIPYIKAWQWFLMAIFPVIGLLYYGLPLKGWQRYNLRRTGWLKPFLIGFAWAGIITFYPLIVYQIQSGYPYVLTFLGVLLFVKNLMFVSILGIMFDIKDYASDYNRRLKTFVVRVGLRKTIFYIIIPLSILGFVTLLAFAYINRFPILRIFFNSIPFVLLLVVAYAMHRRKTIMYYLVVIDGLMLVKAICGILGMLLIN